jgi:AraC-like DNA-binding protein
MTRFWVDPAYPGLSLMHALFTTHEFPPHVHEAFVVAVTETGGSVVKSRGHVEQAHHEALFVFNPGEPHAGWMGRSSHWKYRAFYLAKPSMERLARDIGLRELPGFTRNLFTDRDLIDGFLKLHGACDGLQSAANRDELMADTFGRLFARHGSGRHLARPLADRELLRRAATHMLERFAEPLLLDDVACALGLTKFQLIGLFKRTIGLTPHAYLTQVRLNAACRLLKRGHSLAETAIATGFYDQSAMNRHFKSCYAITPLQFASANRNAPASQFLPIREQRTAPRL